MVALFFFFFMGWPRMQPSPPALQPAFPGGPQSHGHKVFQTCLSEGAGLPPLTLNGTRMARTTARLCVHTHAREERCGPCFGAPRVCEAPPLWPESFTPLDAEVMEDTFELERLCPTGRQCAVKNNQRKKQAACFHCHTQDNSRVQLRPNMKALTSLVLSTLILSCCVSQYAGDLCRWLLGRWHAHTISGVFVTTSMWHFCFVQAWLEFWVTGKLDADSYHHHWDWNKVVAPPTLGWSRSYFPFILPFCGVIFILYTKLNS